MKGKYGCGQRMVDGENCEAPHLCDVCQTKMIVALEAIATMPPHGYGEEMASAMSDLANTALTATQPRVVRDPATPAGQPR